MDAVKYLKELKRMFDSLGRTGAGCRGVDCSECPLSPENNGTNVSCSKFKDDYPELAVEIVEKWSAENPQKTMLQDLLEKYPKIPMNIEGVPRDLCPHDITYCEETYCRYNTQDCKTCWNRPLEG